MSSPVQLPLAARPHHNQQLFSDHYLDMLLPQRLIILIIFAPTPRPRLEREPATNAGREYTNAGGCTMPVVVGLARRLRMPLHPATEPKIHRATDLCIATF